MRYVTPARSSSRRRREWIALRKMLGFLTVGVLLGVGQMASAGPLEDGVAAYQNKDYANALKHFRPLAAQHNSTALYYLALMYRLGYGVARDKREEAKWLQLAAEKGDANAQFELAIELARSAFLKKSPQDGKEAMKWFHLAAAQGNTNAQVALGSRYADGIGVAQDYKEAVRWYRLAAEQGDSHGLSSLGEMYQEGKGVLQDFKEAAKWYRLAAERGNGDAQYRLALMYRNGQGVAQDSVRAHVLFNFASVSLQREYAGWARDKRNELTAKMTPAQIERAQEMARKCQESKFKDCGW